MASKCAWVLAHAWVPGFNQFAIPMKLENPSKISERKLCEIDDVSQSQAIS